MRNTYLLVLLLGLALPFAARAQQPFERFGVKVKVLTLSNGRYPEFFANDSLRRIGSVVYNTRLKRIAYLLPPDSLQGRAPSEITSRWIAVDPLSERFNFISPYAYVANNPLRYIDPDGREIVGTDGNPVTYTRNKKTGQVTFTPNADAATLKIGNALLASRTGTKQLDKLIKSEVEVTLKVDPATKIGTNGKPQRGGTEITATEKQADGKTYKAVSATITIYEGSVNKSADQKGYSHKQVFAGTAGHEIEHAVNQTNANMKIQNQYFQGRYDIETGPDAIRDQIIREMTPKSKTP